VFSGVCNRLAASYNYQRDTLIHRDLMANMMAMREPLMLRGGQHQGLLESHPGNDPEPHPQQPQAGR